MSQKLYNVESKRLNEVIKRNINRFPETFYFQLTDKEEIIIIDNYAGKELLKILSKINKKVIIVSKNISEELIKKYESEYKNIEFKNIDIFHDRFIIIDKENLYSCGASFKDLGKKCFAINEMDSKETIDNLLNRIFK